MDRKSLERYSDILRPFFGFIKYEKSDELEKFIKENDKQFRDLPQSAINALVELTSSKVLKEAVKPEKQSKDVNKNEGGLNIMDGLQLMIDRRVNEQVAQKVAQQVAQRMKEMEQQMEQQIKDAKQQAEDAKQQIKDAKQQAEDAKQQIKDAKQQAEDAKQQAEDAKQQIKDAKQQAEDAKQQAEDAKQQAEDAKQQAENARQQIKDDRILFYLESVQEGDIKPERAAMRMNLSTDAFIAMMTSRGYRIPETISA